MPSWIGRREGALPDDGAADTAGGGRSPATVAIAEPAKKPRRVTGGVELTWRGIDSGRPAHQRANGE